MKTFNNYINEMDQRDIELRRAEMNLHQAEIERDNAVLTYKAKLGNLLKHLVADVEPAQPGEKYDSVLEEILYKRIRELKKILVSEEIID